MQLTAMKRLFLSGLLAAGLTIGTAPNAGAKCGIDWINQQTCSDITHQYMFGQDFLTYLTWVVQDPNDRAAVIKYIGGLRI